MQNCAGAERRRGLADAVLVHEVLRELEPVVDLAEHRVDAGTRTSRSVTSAWSVGMLNVHQKKSTLKPGGVGRHEERGDADRRARLARGAREDDVVRRVVQPGVEPLRAVDHPLVAVADGGRLEVGRVGAVVRLGEPEREPAACRRGSRASTRRCCSSVPKSRIMSTVGKLPTIELSFCRSLCSPRPLAARCSRMIAISRLRRVVTAVLRRQRLAQPARGVGAPAHLARAAPPSRARGTPPFSKSVRAYSRRWSKNRMLSSGLLERPDLALDERVERVERRLDLGRDLEVHGPPVHGFGSFRYRNGTQATQIGGEGVRQCSRLGG